LRIALVAHDNKKADMLQWARFNRETLAMHSLVVTGTTGSLLEDALGLDIRKLLSGPLGGVQQIGAMISQGNSTCWCSSGTPWNHSHTGLTLRRCCG
jgi:methylglyoxal synthase